VPRGKPWLIPALVAGGALAYARFRRSDLVLVWDNLRRFSAPSASLYDAVAAPALGGFYAAVAGELARLAPGPEVLEVGSGPGRLAVKLAEEAPGVRVTGLDLSPEMVRRAGALVASAGVSDRVAFQVGDVASLPFPDVRFDAVVSTLSLHHWRDPARGLAEIHRVLRPGGVALVYDVADWLARWELRGPGIAELLQHSPFGDGGTGAPGVTTRLGPIPLVYRVELRRERSTE
jgi:SAM-dependent methyltransferase